MGGLKKLCPNHSSTTIIHYNYKFQKSFPDIYIINCKKQQQQQQQLKSYSTIQTMEMHCTATLCLESSLHSEQKTKKEIHG